MATAGHEATHLCVDSDDKVWLSDWAANAVVRFDPATERFESFPSDRPGAKREGEMSEGKFVFAQVMDHLPLSTFHRCVGRYAGEHKVKQFS